MFTALPPLQFQIIVRGLAPITLVTAPSGWEGALIEIKRDDKYFGLINTFSVPMDFVLEGARILRTEWCVNGLKGDAQILINELDAPTQGYKNIFTGAVDFSSVKDHGVLDGYKFTVNILPNDLQTLINAYEDTAVQIPINVPEAVLIQIPGIVLNEQATLNFSASSDSRSNAFFVLTIVTNQVNSVFPSIQNSGFVAQDTPNFMTTGEWFMRSQVDNNNVNCYGNMGVIIFPNGPGSRYRITIRRSSDGSIVQTLFNQVVSITLPFQFSWNFIMNGAPGTPLAPLAKGEALSCYFENFDGNTNKGFQMEHGTMFLSYNTVSPPSNIQALPAYYIYKFLIKSIYGMRFNGFTYPTQSNILNSAPWNQLMITSGDAFRPALVNFEYFNPGQSLTPGDFYTVINGPDLVGGTVSYNGHVFNVGDTFVCLPTNISFTSTNGAEVESGNNPAVIKTNFRDFFKSMNAVLNLGFGIQNGVAALEPKSYFFQPGLQITTLTDIQKFEREAYINYIFNSINGGYPDQTYDVLSGRKEVNSKVQYSTPNNKVKKELDIQSVYRADPYGIEFLRVQEGSQNVTKGDNEIFFIMRSANLVGGQVYYAPEGNEAYPSIGGVDTGYFNYSITPKQNLSRHGNFIAGMMGEWEGQILVAEALKSTGLVTINNAGVQVSESAPVDISTLPTKLFLPYVVTITTDLPVNILTLLDMFPTGYIAFEVDGNTYYGFLISAKFNPGKNKPQEYKLLLTAQNNMLDFIH